MFRFRNRFPRWALPAAVLALAGASAISSGAGAATVSAEAGKVARLPNSSRGVPLPTKQPPGFIAIDKVSDGCGQKRLAVQGARSDVRERRRRGAQGRLHRGMRDS